MQKSQLPRFPWDKIDIATTDPYPNSYNGNKYLIIAMDLLTSYPEAYPLPENSTQTIAKVLTNKLIPTQPGPIIILSDNGTEYRNKIVKDVFRKLKIEKIYTSPYHPQRNGKLEGWHRMLHDSMRKMIQDDEDNKLIPKILMVYRIISNASGTSPFFNICGRDPILTINTLLQPRPKYIGTQLHR